MRLQRVACDEGTHVVQARKGRLIPEEQVCSARVQKWNVAMIRVTLVPMLYCSAWLRQWMLAKVLDWFTQICLALKHVHDHRSVSACRCPRFSMRSRIGESWRCALGLIDNATPCQCCNRAVPLVGRVWQCWSLHTL